MRGLVLGVLAVYLSLVGTWAFADDFGSPRIAINKKAGSDLGRTIINLDESQGGTGLKFFN